MFTETIPAAGTAPIVKLCEAQLQRLIGELERSPSRTAFFDIGTVAEVLILAAGSYATQGLIEMLSDAADGWLKSGLMEELGVARAEFAYHIALLCYMAQSSAFWIPSDMEGIAGLANGRLIARNEIPVLRQHLLTAYFSGCGVQADFGQLGRRDLVKIVDRRVLRARSDEFDLLVLIMCAQLLQFDGARQKPRVYPQVMLGQAIRSKNTNWIPVLTLLCQRFFGLPEPLHRTALKVMQESIPAEGELLTAPPGHQIDSEYLERTEKGLRLRSTIALAVSLSEMGELL